MKLVKENNSVLMVGERVETVSLERLKEYGFELNPAEVAFLDLDDCKYKNESNKNTRLHSQKTKCILECLYHLNFDSIKKNYDPRRIGIYINGAPHQHRTKDFFNSKESIFEVLRDSLNPIEVVKKTLGVLPGHIAIFHELHGPTFAIGSMNNCQIYQKAKLDLEDNIIDLAIVAFVNIYEDSIFIANHSRLAKNRLLSEAARVTLLTKETTLKFDHPENATKYFGFLENLIPNLEA